MVGGPAKFGAKPNGLSSAAEDGGEAEGKVDAEAAELDLAESYVAGRDLEIGSYQQGEAIADAGLGAHRQIQRGEKVIGVTGIAKSFCDGSVVKVIVVTTVFVGEQIRGGTYAGEKDGAAGSVEVIPEVEGYLQHIEPSFYIIDGRDSAHPHAIMLIVAVGNMIVLWGGGKDLSGEQQSGTDIPVTGELIIHGDAEGAACLVARDGVDGSEVGGSRQAEQERPVDMKSALAGDELVNGVKRKGAEGGVVDRAGVGKADGSADRRERYIAGSTG